MEGHFKSFTTALEDEVKRVEAMRNEVETKDKALKVEKESMMKIEVEDDDVISLNIGGTIMAAARSTLCQVEGSLLASMFSGRWEDRLKKDKHGNVFLDFNPDCFKLILNYLRAKKLEKPNSSARKPTPPKEEESNYWNLIDYLGLRDELELANVKELDPDPEPILELQQKPRRYIQEPRLDMSTGYHDMLDPRPYSISVPRPLRPEQENERPRRNNRR